MTQDGGLDRGSKGQVCATKEFQDRTLLYQNSHNQMMIPHKTLTLTNEVDGQQKQKYTKLKSRAEGKPAKRHYAKCGDAPNAD